MLLHIAPACPSMLVQSWMRMKHPRPSSTAKRNIRVLSVPLDGLPKIRARIRLHHTRSCQHTITNRLGVISMQPYTSFTTSIRPLITESPSPRPRRPHYTHTWPFPTHKIPKLTTMLSRLIRPSTIVLQHTATHAGDLKSAMLFVKAYSSLYLNSAAWVVPLSFDLVALLPGKRTVKNVLLSVCVRRKSVLRIWVLVSPSMSVILFFISHLLVTAGFK